MNPNWFATKHERELREIITDKNVTLAFEVKEIHAQPLPWPVWNLVRLQRLSGWPAPLDAHLTPPCIVFDVSFDPRPKHMLPCIGYHLAG